MKKNISLKLVQDLLTALCFLSFTMITSQTVTQTFNASQTYIIPPDVTSITLEAWGGGGGGGGGNNASALRGGGGGAYSKTVLAVTPGTTYNIQIGVGGSGTGNPGGTGGDTGFYLGATYYILAKGGIGGGSATGVGGLASAGIGTTRFSGGTGGTNGGSNNGGGGGGSAGSTGNGGNGGNGIAGTGGGAGGTAGPGTPGGATGGAGGTRNAISGAAGAGIAGSAPGGGGGGRSSSLVTSNTGGGTGGTGRVTISYATNFTDLSLSKIVSNATPFPGDVITFSITVTNKKVTRVAASTVLTDLLPSGYTFIAASQSGYNSSTGVWNIGNMAANTSTTLTITAMVNDTGVYNNTATVTSDTMPDDDTTNNTAIATVTVCKGGSTAPQVKQ